MELEDECCTVSTFHKDTLILFTLCNCPSLLIFLLYIYIYKVKFSIIMVMVATCDQKF